jgi:hypothetical protein
MEEEKNPSNNPSLETVTQHPKQLGMMKKEHHSATHP